MMQLPWGEYLKIILNGQPNVGSLMDLCEENYTFIMRLLPQLPDLPLAHYCSESPKQSDLYVEILDQAKYTSELHITYYFDRDSKAEPDPDPDVILKVYHDARQVEVINLKQSRLPIHSLYESPGLENKWRANLFVSKWLMFCLHQQHRFPIPS